jgi:hypothetical protein
MCHAADGDGGGAPHAIEVDVDQAALRVTLDVIGLVRACMRSAAVRRTSWAGTSED